MELPSVILLETVLVYYNPEFSVSTKVLARAIEYVTVKVEGSAYPFQS